MKLYVLEESIGNIQNLRVGKAFLDMTAKKFDRLN